MTRGQKLPYLAALVVLQGLLPVKHHVRHPVHGNLGAPADVHDLRVGSKTKKRRGNAKQRKSNPPAEGSTLL